MDYTADASDLRDCIAARFARWLRLSRESRQLTQEALAERTAYLSVHAIKSFEQGIRCPSLWAVVQLRAALGLSCADWLDVPSAPVYGCPVTQTDCIRHCAPTRCAIAAGF
jgi:ribosome-binding protein aMBF1 (putative translation factor)